MPRSDVPERLRALERYADAPRFFCLRRPLLIHGRGGGPAADAPLCPCCESPSAAIIEEREHLDVLIDVVTGERSVLQLLTDARQIEQWHELAADPEVIELYNPARCTVEAAPAFEDLQSAIIYLDGGSQAGKSQTGFEVLWSRVLLRGGRGARFLVVAFERKHTQVAVDKLIRGIQGAGWVPPIIPRELVRSFPDSDLAKDQTIALGEGTILDLRYASRDGNNLRGVVAVDAIFDEASACRHEENFSILVARLLTTGGQLLVPSTPMEPGHWLQRKSEGAKYYDEIAELRAAGKSVPSAARVTLSCRDNPWADPKHIAKLVIEMGGPDSPTTKRNIDGLWVFTEGDLFWETWDPTVHCVPWTDRKIPDEWIDLTSLYVRRMFNGFSQDRNAIHFGGTDYNNNPYSTVICRVLCRRDQDSRDVGNHVLLVEDCIVARCKSAWDYASFVAREAGKLHGRGLPENYYAGLHTIGDANGFHRGARGRKNVSADADALKSEGWVVRAPKYSALAKAENPSRRLRHGIVKELMWTGPRGEPRPPRLLVNKLRCAELIKAFEEEIGDGRGDVKKTSNTKADRISGISDALGYAAYVAFFDKLGPANDDPAPRVIAAGWS